MIYVDASVVLAELFGEARRPPRSLWDERLTSSGLIEYEILNRLHARRLGDALQESVDGIFQRLRLVEFNPVTLRRALEPFPSPLRTLDALHLASADFLRQRGERVTVATYDHRFATAAEALGFALEPL